jgi:predicted RNA-binding Zn-ribbon protein involved in translation (DUF1610 family)
MSISFQCPACGKKLKAPDNAAGKSSTCPGCGGRVTCPEPIYDAEVVEMELAPEKPKGFDPYAEMEDDKPYGVVEPEPQEQVPDDGRRPCPMCGEMIVAGAAKCRYCGEVFDATLKKAKSKKKKKKYGADEEDLGAGDIVVALICSGIGCIAGLVWMIQGKPKGLKMFGLSFLMVVIWNIVSFVIQSVLNKGGAGGP